MPNLRSKTWTTTTPAYVEDAQFWEDHLISDAVAAKAASSVQTVNSTAPDANGNVDVVALPAGGTVGQVLTKKSSTDGDADWENPASSGHTIKDEDGVSMTQQPTLQFLNADVTNDSVNSATVVDCKGAKGDAATIAVGTTTTLAAGSDATVTNSGTSSAAVFNFGIPKGADGADGADGSDGADGVSVTGVELLSTSGKVKTYRMSFSNGDHFDYQVTDGADGTGAGDMLASDYDADSTVLNAGGITSYVASQAYSLPTASTSVLGGIKIGTNLSIDANGVLSATDTNTDALHDLTDVNISLPSDGQALLYDSSSSKWVNGDVAGSAADISYDNTSSGLTADDVQEAIDEIDSNLDTLDGKVYKTDDSTETTIASDDLLPIYDTSATAAKKITVANVVKATVSNPNLLDNPWFTVNQRGQTSYTDSTGYCLDRWIRYSSLAVTVNADGSITITNNSNAVAYFGQRLPLDIIPYVKGRKLTLSAKISSSGSNSTIYAGYGTSNDYVILNTLAIPTSLDIINVGINIPSNISDVTTFEMANISIGAGESITVYAFKLEVGDISTLALDTAPNYATELLKCQRYFFRSARNTLGTEMVGYGWAASTTIARISFWLPTCMRTAPTVTVSDVSKYRIFGKGQSIVASAIAFGFFENNVVALLVTVGTNMTQNELYGLANGGDGTNYIDFSADL